jgi:S-formylglutathione hydrolase FrmB
MFTTLVALLFVSAIVPGSPADRAASAPPTALRFRLSFDERLQGSPYSGRVYVVVAHSQIDEPRTQISNWFRPPHIFARDLRDHHVSQPVDVEKGCMAFPGSLAELPPGEYRVQAIARRSLDYPVPGEGPGDLFSDPVTVVLNPVEPSEVELKLTRIVEEGSFEESENVKLVDIVSSCLSRFHGRDIRIRAAVVLPDGWSADSEATYPVLYMVSGFGGSHTMARAIARSRPPDSPGRKVLLVVPDATCYHGHSVFADSENNGPWGEALVRELIPAVEKRFHGARSGAHRYVTGVSSGGWSALWLQITYPDEFNGCWSHCPDPVDFRDFQRINLYAEGSNLFVDEKGERRPLARRGDTVMLWYDDFLRREEVLGSGGQIRSFGAVFGRKASDGRPEAFFDPATGKVNTNVTRTWERYDIRLVIERNWSELEPKLRGKLHIYAGEKDTFYLEGAVSLLKDSLARLGSDAEVVIVPGMAHGLYRDAVEPMYRTILSRYEDR